MKIQRTHLLKRLDTLYLSYNTSFGNWKNSDHYVNLRGPRGSGKTTLILEWLEQHKHFYFSFAGLDEPMALRLLGERLQKYMNDHNLTALPMDTWENVFLNINTLSERTCHIFAFDDADEILTDSIFSAAFQSYLSKEKRRAILIIFVTRAEKLPEFPPDYTKWTYDEIPIDVPYFSIADLCKCFPNKKGDDLLELYALTGGIPAIVDRIDENLSTEKNLRSLLSSDTPYIHFGANEFDHLFRRSESYMFICYSVALGNNRVSDIGKFTGFAYNKCDKYIRALIENGILTTGKDENNKTVYKFVNPYYRIWFNIVYPNRTDINLGAVDDLTIFQALSYTKTVADGEYVSACYRHAYYHFCKRRYIDRETVSPTPQTFTANVMKKDKYGQPYKDSEATITFDLVYNDGEYNYAMLILKDEHYLGKAEFEAIKSVIEDAFWLDFTFFICYNKGRICEEAYRFAKFNEYVKWEMIDRLRF